MTTANAASNPFAAALAGAAEGGSQDEQLDRAIAELRGVLHEDDGGSGVSPDFLASLGGAAPGFGGAAPAFGGLPGGGMPGGMPGGGMPSGMPGGGMPSGGMGGGGFGGGGAAMAGASGAPGSGGVIMNIPVEVQIVLGTAEMPVAELMALQRGSTVALDRRIGEPVEVVVNGRRIARGEITVLDSDPSRFGIRLTEITGAAG